MKLSDELVTYISGKTRIISNEMQWSLNRVEPIEPNKRIYECRNLSFFMHYLYLGWQNSADWLALCIYRRRTVEWYRAKSAFFVCLIWKVTSTIQSDPKGQLISKCHFGVFKSTKKTKNIFVMVMNLFWLSYTIFWFHLFFEARPGQKYKNMFVCFLVQMKTLKFAFEIYWPLVELKRPNRA